MTNYWLGVLTVPALVAALALLVVAYFRALAALARIGITFQARWRRDVDSISEYTLRNNIWWERSFGPIFIGGWYREQPRYPEPAHKLINRWVGVGRASGPNVVVFRSRDLGEATS